MSLLMPPAMPFVVGGSVRSICSLPLLPVLRRRCAGYFEAADSHVVDSCFERLHDNSKASLLNSGFYVIGDGLP